VIEFVNPVAEALTGWPQGEALGRESGAILTILDEEKQTRLEDPLSRVLQEGTVIASTEGAMLQGRDGSETPVDYSAGPLKDDEGRIIGGVLVFRDITERKQAALQIARRLAQTQTLREVMLAAASTLDFDQVLERTCQILPAMMKVEFLRFALIDDQERGLRIHPARIGYAPSPEQAFLPLDNGLLSQVCRTGEAVLIRDVREEPDYTGLDPELRAALAVPVHVGGKVFGVLNLESRLPNAFEEEDLTFYTAIAGQLGIALENARLYQEVSRHAEESEAALIRMQELDRLKTEFMQNVSHELRTPVSLVLGYTEWLADDELGELPTEQREMMRIVQRQVHILHDLVEDISLTWLSEIHPLAHKPVALDAMLNTVLDDYRPQARQAGLRLHGRIARDLPTIQGVPGYLRRVWVNLLTNAIKFTPAGGRINLHLLRQGNWLVVKVSDTGIGIPPGEHERIFDRFYQVDGSIRRKYGGTGLGLALVKQIVEAHGGTVNVESHVGKGSTFTVTLPAAEPRG
jgi:PAS domain S-box-containing protein